jgi:hypothetical protein
MDLRFMFASLNTYGESFGLAPSLPKVEALAGNLHVGVDSTLKFTLATKAMIKGFPDSGTIRLTPQEVAVNLSFEDSIGKWSLASKGNVHIPDTSAEDIALAGNVSVTQTDSLLNPAYLIKHLGISAHGHIRGVKVVSVVTAGKSMPAEMEIAEALWSQEMIKVDFSTGEGSRVQAKIYTGSNPLESNFLNGRGDFSGDLVQGERWIQAFTDTNLVFQKLHLEGHSAKGKMSAIVEATGLRIYGGLADNIRLNLRYGTSGLRLDPSPWTWNGKVWTVSALAKFSKHEKLLSVRCENSEFGSLEYSMPRPGLMEVHAQNLVLEKLPYRRLDSLARNHPRVRGIFVWDQGADTGHAEISAQAQFKNQNIQADLKAAWTREFFEVHNLTAEFAGSQVSAEAKVRLLGRPFYTLGKVQMADLVALSLKSDGFDLAQALAQVLPNRPLKSAMVTGDFSYSESHGFAGAYNFKNLRFHNDSIPLEMKELALFGQGDILSIKAVTVSLKEPLFNDTLDLALTGALGKVQTLMIGVKSVDGFAAKFQGSMQGYQNIEGKLALDGNMALPNKHGELRNLMVRTQLVLPFRQGLAGLRLDADTLSGAYTVPGIDTQYFSATVKTREDKIAIPDLLVKSKGGELQGRLDYAIRTKRLSVTLSGQSLVAQLGPGQNIQIRDFRIDAQADSTLFNLQAAIGSLSAEQVKPPMRNTGDFSRVSLVYRLPLGKSSSTPAGTGALPFLRLSAVVDSSSIRYRIRSLESLQALFKKSAGSRHANRRTKPVQVQINLETSGTRNYIETDILRLSYVGNVSMVGTYPYALMRGRITARDGSLGTKKQAYRIRRMEVKWLNTPLEEGKLDMDSEKKLARSCEANVMDSCSVLMRLGGALNNMQFSYDSDCQGAYGDGVQVSALVFSVRRGCYSSGFASKGGGLTYKEQALTLLETPLSGYLSDAAEKLSGKWIASAQVTGLGALVKDKSKATSEQDSGSGTTTRDAIALEILSKEFWRIRLRAKSAYKPDLTEAVNPWAYLMGLEWRPPLFQFIDNPIWKRRVKNSVSLDASVFTDPARAQEGQSTLLRRVGLNYNYDFWGYWWAKPLVKDSIP